MSKNYNIERDTYSKRKDDDFPRIKHAKKPTYDYDYEEEELLEYMNKSDISRWKLG